ncbi:hypothetical protein B9479_008010, partial [Cryptococcus floricola]
MSSSYTSSSVNTQLDFSPAPSRQTVMSNIETIRQRSKQNQPTSVADIDRVSSQLTAITADWKNDMAH